MTRSQTTILSAAALLLLAWPTAEADAACWAPENCPCETLAERILARATVSALPEGRIEVTVDEDFGDSYFAEPGTTVGGAWDGTRPCDGEALQLEVGDSVLVAYERGDQDRYPGCVEYLACEEQDCAALRGQASGDSDEAMEADATWDECSSACIESTREACAAHDEEARLGGSIAVVAWGDDLVFGPDREAERVLRPEDLPEVVDGEARLIRSSCQQILPPVELPPCEDSHGVNTSETVLGCAVGGAKGTAGFGVLMLAGLLVVGLGRRR